MPKKLTVVIDDELSEQLDLAARSQGLTKQDLVKKILKSYIEGTIITEETLENTNAKCIWEAIKILNAIKQSELMMEERRLMMELRLKRKYLLSEIAHATNLAKALAKYAERLKSSKELPKEEERKLGELLETFLYGLAARMGLLPEEWVTVEEESSAGQGKGGNVTEEEEESEAEEEGTSE